MKTKILAATLVMAISASAWADAAATRVNTETKTETEEKEKKAAEKADSKPAEKKEGTDSKSTTSSDAPKRAERENSVTKREFIDNEGKKNDLVLIERGGKVQAYVTPVECSDGVSCTSVALLDKKITDPFVDIEAALRKSLSENKAQPVAKRADDSAKSTDDSRVSKRRDRTEDSSVKEFREEIRADLADALASECRIDVETARSKRRYEVDAQDTLSKALVGSRFAQIELPRENKDALCAGRTLKAFMREKDEEMSELDLDEESVAELRGEISDLKKDIRKEKDPREKARLEKLLATKEEEFKSIRKEAESNRKKIQAANAEVGGFVDSYLMKAAVQDVAASPHAGLTYLHDLASGTSDYFSSVRKSASTALLNVYKLQAQSQLALRDAASKTTDPVLKSQYLEAANAYSSNGMAFNTTMINPASKESMRDNAYRKYLGCKELGPCTGTLDEVRNAQAYANSVVNDIYSSYSTGAQQITSYLSGLNTGTNGLNGSRTQNPGSVAGIPQILADGTIAGSNAGIPTTGNGGMRAARMQQQYNGLNNGRNGNGQPHITRGRPAVMPRQ